MVPGTNRERGTGAGVGEVAGAGVRYIVFSDPKMGLFEIA